MKMGLTSRRISSSIWFCIFLFAIQVRMGLCAEGGDIDDWNDYRTFYALAASFIIFGATVESDLWKENENDSYPIITAWVWCMIILGFWATNGIAQ